MNGVNLVCANGGLHMKKIIIGLGVIIFLGMGIVYFLLNDLLSTNPYQEIASKVIYSVEAPQDLSEEKNENDTLPQPSEAAEVPSTTLVSKKLVNDTARTMQEVELMVQALSQQLGELKRCIVELQGDNNEVADNKTQADSA